MSPDGRLREVVHFACRVCPRVGRYRLAVLAVLHSRLKPRRLIANHRSSAPSKAHQK